MKLFKIEFAEKDFTIGVLKITILGIKFSFKIIKPEHLNFAFHYFGYLNKIKKSNKHNKTRRLFMTSGNLSLINTLAILNQFNLNENSENSILVWSHVASDEFIEISKKISELTEIKNYYSFCNVSFMDLLNHFIISKQDVFDEIYFPNCRYMFEIAKILFPFSKYFVIEEGICVQMKHKSIDYSNVEKFIFNKYLDKIDLANASQEDLKKLCFIDKKEFLQIGQKAAELYPLDLKLNKEDKNIILCGTIAGLGIMSFNEIVEYQNKIADKLIEMGYTVIFKPHPRDTSEYKEHEKFKILKTKLPLEVYNIEDKCLAVVSIFSSASCQIYHFQNIAGFCAEDINKNCSDFGLNIIAEYSPSYDMLCEIDTNNKTFAEVKKEILCKYKEWLNNKPLLSENEYLQKVYDKLPFIPPSVEFEKIHSLFNKFNGFLFK